MIKGKSSASITVIFKVYFLAPTLNVVFLFKTGYPYIMYFRERLTLLIFELLKILLYKVYVHHIDGEEETTIEFANI